MVQYRRFGRQNRIAIKSALLLIRIDKQSFYVAAAVAIRALSLPSISSGNNNNKQKLLHNNTYDEVEELRYNDNTE